MTWPCLALTGLDLTGLDWTCLALTGLDWTVCGCVDYQRVPASRSTAIRNTIRTAPMRALVDRSRLFGGVDTEPGSDGFLRDGLPPRW